MLGRHVLNVTSAGNLLVLLNFSGVRPSTMVARKTQRKQKKKQNEMDENKMKLRGYT